VDTSIRYGFCLQRPHCDDSLEKNWGQAAVYREVRVVRAPITDLMKPALLVDPDHRWVKQALALGIFI